MTHTIPDDINGLKSLVRQLLSEVRQLRTENEQLHADNQRLRRENERLQTENEQLQGRLDEALRGRFAAKSERRCRVPRERAEKSDGDPSGHGRAELPAHLPRHLIEHDLSEAEKACPCCGQPRCRIGKTVSEQLDFEPPRYFVLQHVRYTYACDACDGDVEQRFTTAGPSTLGPIPKGLPASGLLAQIITSKYADHLPLHRLEHIVSRSGVHIARSTLCDWMRASALLLRPLSQLMHQRILDSRVIHSDDTPVPYLMPGRPDTATGHLWVYLGDTKHPYVLFDFTQGYSRDGPEKFLKGYQGYLQADALAQYEGLYATGQVVHVACWAHARRKFVEAETTDAESAGQALELIGQLYRVERQRREADLTDAGERLKQRREGAFPILEQLHAWLQQRQATALPKSPLGQAVGYALSNWEALQRYTEADYLAIDNNLSERTLRQVAVGRKNWMFCGSSVGGETAAVLYSVVGTCRHLGIDPFAYLREALDGLYALGQKPGEAELSAWLPDRRLRSRREAARLAPSV